MALLIFFLLTCNQIDNYINRYTLNSLKDIVLQENMTSQINILNQPIISIPSNMQISVIENIKQLQELLFSLDNVNICIGANDDARDIENLDYNLAYKDICNTWRHKKCLLILPDSLKNICKFCSNMKKSLNRKHLRKKSNSVKRIRIILPNAEKRRKLLALQYKYNKTEKARKRATYVANKLKTDLTNCMIKFKEASEKNIEDILKEKQVPNNQCIAIREIMNAIKHDNPKGCRYNDEWILLSMLMHMKSPTAYNFLRSNNILPLPCIRSIRRSEKIYIM